MLRFDFLQQYCIMQKNTALQSYKAVCAYL